MDLGAFGAGAAPRNSWSGLMRMNERGQTQGQRATAVLSATLARTSGTTEAASRVDRAASNPHDAGLGAQLDAGLARSAEMADHGNGTPATAQPT